MITIGIATLFERQNSFRKTIESLYEQADTIHCVLNFYKSVPSWLADLPKVHYHFGENLLGASGKFLMSGKVEGYYFGCDDDLIYPTTYVRDMMNAIDEYNCIVTLHGKCFANRPLKSYRRDFTTNIRCLNALGADVFIDVCGTGVCGWHTDDFKLDIGNFMYPNKVDVELSREAHKQGVKMIAIAHPKNYLQYIKPTGKTVWEMEIDDSIQTAIVNEFLSDTEAI